MKIGIIGAMKQEILLLQDSINYSVKWQKAGCEIYTGYLNGIEIALVKSGIGKTFASLGTTLLLNYFKPELVINIGSAGSLGGSLKIGDIVISHEVRYHDVDVTAFGYAPGQIPQCPAVFNVSSSLCSIAEEIANYLDIHAIRGLIVSGDTFIKDKYNLSRIRKIFPKAIAVDMESAAIAHICHQFNVKFIVIRGISDIVEQTSPLDFEEFLTIATRNYSLLTGEIVHALA